MLHTLYTQTVKKGSFIVYKVDNDWNLTEVKRFPKLSICDKTYSDGQIEIESPAIVLFSNGAGHRYIRTYGLLPPIPEKDSNMFFLKYVESSFQGLSNSEYSYAEYLLGCVQGIRIPRDGRWVRIEAVRLQEDSLSHGSMFVCFRYNYLHLSSILVYEFAAKVIHRISEDGMDLDRGIKKSDDKADLDNYEFTRIEPMSSGIPNWENYWNYFSELVNI